MTKDDEPVVETTYLTARSGDASDVRDRLLETVGDALARPGASGFSVLQSTADDDAYLVVERWTSDAARLMHADTPILATALVIAQPSAERSRWRRII